METELALKKKKEEEIVGGWALNKMPFSNSSKLTQINYLNMH